MKRPGMISRTPIGLDIGARRIKAVQLGRAGGQWRLLAATSIPRHNEDGLIDEPEIRRLCEILDRQGFVGNRAIVAVPWQKVLTGVLELPPTESGAPLTRIARMEFGRMHGCEPFRLEMAFWRLPPSPGAKDNNQTLAVGCTHAEADALLDALELGGLQVEALDTHVCALARAYAPMAQGTGIIAILDLGWTEGRLVLLYQGTVIYERALPEAGVAPLAEALTDKFGLNQDERELLLADVGMAEKRTDGGADVFAGPRRMILRHFERGLAEIEAPLRYAMGQYPSAKVDRILLSGGGAAIPALDGSLAPVLDTDTRAASPIDLMQCSRALPANCNGASLATAVGLAQMVN